MKLGADSVRLLLQSRATHADAAGCFADRVSGAAMEAKGDAERLGLGAWVAGIGDPFNDEANEVGGTVDHLLPIVPAACCCPCGNASGEGGCHAVALHLVAELRGDSVGLFGEGSGCNAVSLIHG